MAKGRRCMPKGIFRYATHEEANRDQEKWLAQRMAEAHLRYTKER